MIVQLKKKIRNITINNSPFDSRSSKIFFYLTTKHNKFTTMSAAIKSTSARRFAPTTYENTCNRCNHLVYSAEKIGPLKDFTFYHHGCFKCALCGSKLTLKTYFNNQQDQDDKEVCKKNVDSMAIHLFHFSGSMHETSPLYANRCLLRANTLPNSYITWPISFISLLLLLLLELIFQTPNYVCVCAVLPHYN